MSAVLEPAAAICRTVPLTEAVELNPKPDRSSLSDDLEVSFVPMAAVEPGTGGMDATRVRRYAEVKKGYTYFREGDVLFAKITPCMENGKMAVARHLRNGVGFGSTEFHVLRPREGVDPYYVYHFVSSARFRAAAAHNMTGAVGQKRVQAAFLEQSEIPLPSIDEQRRMVAEIEKQFSRLDEAVANFKRVRAHIRRYKAAVIEEAASGTTACDLSVIELLSDVFKTGISIKKSESGGVPSLKLSALRDGRIDFTQSKLLPVRVDEVRQILLRPGDFLVTRGNGSIKLVGAGALVEIVPGPVIYPDLLIRVRMRADTIEPRWLNLVWRTKYVRMQIERKAKTTAGIYKISQRDLGSIKLPAPSLEEQKRITAEVERRLSVVEDLETQMSQESMRAARLRESVLAHAFSSTRSSSLGGQSEELRS